VPTATAERTDEQPHSSDIEIAPEFREPLRSWIACRARSFNTTTLDESEMVALKQRLAIMGKHETRSSARWRVAIAAFLVCYENLMKEHGDLPEDRMRRCIDIEAGKVAGWYTSEKWAARSPAYYIKRLLDYPVVAAIGATLASSD
jgi:hypothetical protein